MPHRKYGALERECHIQAATTGDNETREELKKKSASKMVADRLKLRQRADQLSPPTSDVSVWSLVLCGAVIKEMTNLRCGRNRFCCGRLAMGSGATFAAAATVATLIAEITGRLARSQVRPLMCPPRVQ